MNELHEQILQAIKDRKDWEDRQSTWYSLRHEGLRRKSKPYRGAPDMHFPLIDASIDKHKPFYVQQIYGTDTLAAFVAKNPEQTDTQEIGAWFDYKVKQESNFEREAICGIDTLLQNGGCPVKVFWRESKKRLEFDSCDPLHVIVPKWTEELQDADWLVHVLHVSEAQYRRNPNFNKEDDFIKSIKGKGDAGNEDTQKAQEIANREGLTYGQNDSQIVLWEIYTRNPADANKIIVKTRSPLKFEEAVRPDFQLPYTEGVFKDGWFPFVKWRGEIKDKGYYSARGHAEILAPFETALCKSWNFKHEHMDFFARPMFEQSVDSTAGNTGNFNSAPGAIVPQGLKPVQAPAMPESLNEDMNMTRQLAEYRVQAPDFGILAENGGKRTATEISAISGQTGQGTDLRARIFRLDLGDTYRMAWSILLQFGKESLSYVLDGDAKSMSPDALSDAYEVMPNGSADSWNKGQQMAKATTRFQMFTNNPYIKQGPLVKSVLAADESGLVKTLYQEPQDAQASEAEEQAEEISIMLLGFPAAIDPTDDDKMHLITMAQWADQTLKNGEQIDPRMARLVLKHGMEHTNALAQKKDPMARQISQQLQPLIQILAQIARQPDPREIAAAQAQANVIPMEQGPGSSHGAISQPAPVPQEPQPQGAMP